RLPEHVAAPREEPRALAGCGGGGGAPGPRGLDPGAGAQRPARHDRAGARAAGDLEARAAWRRAPRARDDIEESRHAHGQGAHRSVRTRAALPATARVRNARRVGAVAACQDARVGSTDRHSLGGAAPRALQRRPAAVGTPGVRRMAFDPETSLEGIFASLVCAAEEILIDVFKATVHKATNPAVRRLMELILRDEVRHIAFGWQCLDTWAPSFTPETVRNIESAVITMIEHVEFRGYRNLWLAIEGGSATPAEIDADRISCEAGLGGNTPE